METTIERLKEEVQQVLTTNIPVSYTHLIFSLTG